MTYQELQAARQVLGLAEDATLKAIKDRHRQLVKRHHPDSGSEPNDAVIRAVNAAYQLIDEYVAPIASPSAKPIFTNNARKSGFVSSS